MSAIIPISPDTINGKYIAFRYKNKARFTRYKIIGDDYTEERLKERIAEREFIKTPDVKKRIGNIIDMNTNTKVKESKSYKFWATKHNLNTMAESVFISESMILNLLNSLTSIFKKRLMKDNICKIKSELLIRRCRSFMPLWNKFIPLKNTGSATRNIR